MDGIENFYPRPPRGGRRFLLRPHGGLVGFLSTPSARRATRRCPMRSRFIMYFYPRPPRGGRHRPDRRLCGFNSISIHALREEGDAIAIAQAAEASVFLSTPSARRATGAIHGGETFQWNFYPRPPRGGRPQSTCKEAPTWQFLSTPSARRATPDGGCVALWTIFLSTPSARRATSSTTAISQLLGNFYPRPPRGGRHRPSRNRDKARKFLSTPSARRATFGLLTVLY